MKKKIAVILAGNGVYDGSEIHETTMAMYAIAKNDMEYMCFAPNIPHAHVINHLTGEEMNESRNVLVEAARLARGQVKDLKQLNVDEYDAILIPGGFGAAKNLCDFAFKGDAMTVLPELEEIIKAFHKKQKPIGALCIAPTIIAKVLGAKVTIGTDTETAKAIVSMGGVHEEKSTIDITIDEKNKIVTNPCYMSATNIYEIGEGSEACVEAMKGLM
ncbi:MAG: isoprenoid biosynthesis glyoxalase ElbB [Bacteroidota bacterium]|nr:isoprenoid biosynthesis glyoxalase ElbB [Bacteroidota bacterium]